MNISAASSIRHDSAEAARHTAEAMLEALCAYFAKRDIPFLEHRVRKIAIAELGSARPEAPNAHAAYIRFRSDTRSMDPGRKMPAEKALPKSIWAVCLHDKDAILIIASGKVASEWKRIEQMRAISSVEELCLA